MPASGLAPRDLLRHLRQYLEVVAGYKLAFLAMVALLVAKSAFQSLGMGMLIPLLDNLTGTSSAGSTAGRMIDRGFALLGVAPTVVNVIVVFFGLILLKNLLFYIETVYTARLRRDLVLDVSRRVFDNLMTVGYRFFHDTRRGDIAYYLTGNCPYVGHALLDLSQLAMKLCVSASYLVLLFLISPLLTLITLGCLGVYVFLFRGRVGAALAISRDQTRSGQECNSFLVEVIDGIKIVKAFLREDHERERFARCFREYHRHLYRAMKNTALIEFLREPVAVAILIVLFGFAVGKLHLTIGLLGTYLAVLYLFIPNVQGLLDYLNRLANSLPPIESTITALGREGKPYLADGTRPLAPLARAVEFRDVDFHYLPERPVLHRVGFRMEKDRMTAIVGATGAGKSTILDLLMRLYDPIGGAVLVDGTDLREAALASWRGQLAIVTQETFIFNDTIAANIRYGKLDATDDEVAAAARLAQADGFIRALPQGYATPVGERGVKLSGGQKQMLALARALVRQPRVLVLDEATSSLDNQSERLIQQAIAGLAGKLTIVVIAHRLSTIVGADRIVVLEQGRVVEQGSHAELLARNGPYSRYYRLQFTTATEASNA